MSSYVYRYHVTHSTVPSVPVGSRLVDKRRDLVKTWTIYNSESCELTEFTARRGARCCSECHEMRWVRDYGHGGPHGESAPYTPDEVVA